VNLSPQIIVGGSALECVLRTVFVEHALEDHHVAGSHVDDLKADIVGVGIHVVVVAPFAAGNERHGIFIGDIRGELDLHPKILFGRDLFWAVQSKSANADICDVPNQLLTEIVVHWHVICKVTTSNFPFVSHDDCSFLLTLGKYMPSINKIPGFKYDKIGHCSKPIEESLPQTGDLK
jgi:hypothetical protein